MCCEQTLTVRLNTLPSHHHKSVFSFLRQLTTRHCSHLLLSAVLRRRYCWAPDVQQSIDISCQNPQHAAECGGRMMGQTDRRTPDRYTEPAPHTENLELATRRRCFGWSFVVVHLSFGTCKIKSVFDRQDVDAFMCSVFFIYLDLHY